jgi:hypothetical protein
MSLGTLLRGAAIIGACIWTLFLIRGWSAVSDMQAMGGRMYQQIISDAQQSLTIQTIVVILLFLGGIFIKGSPTADQANEAKDSPNNSLPSNGRFNGSKDLNSDAYKIYLVKKWSIEKNDALNKFILKDKLFDSIEEATKHANDLESEWEATMDSTGVTMGEAGTWICPKSGHQNLLPIGKCNYCGFDANSA